jgi:hypothetical protein
VKEKPLMWQRIRSWFTKEAVQLTVAFLPDEESEPVRPYEGYLRIFFAEGFLARQREWGVAKFPALYGGVSLSFLGGTSTFTSFSRPPDYWMAPGAHQDYPMTELLPFSGGTVEVEAALYEATSEGPLGTAIGLIGGFAELLGPPLNFAAQVAEKVSQGLDQLLGASGTDPVLALHATMVSPGGGGRALRSGHLVVLAEPGLKPVMKDGRLHLDDKPATGVDYLVVRVECRTERDDWRFPELDAAIRAAGDAFLNGYRDVFEDKRKEAIVRAWNSPDLTPVDRKRAAMLVKEELDSLAHLGAMPEERTWDRIVDELMRPADDPALATISLDEMLA